LLSIKAFFGGRAQYDVGRGHYAVDDQTYLLLNDRQPYRIALDSARPVESFCVFFARGLAEEVQRSVTTPSERLLDSPAAADEPALRFFDGNYRHDDLLSPALLRLRSAYGRRQGEANWLTEQLHGLVERLLQAHQHARRDAERLSAVRSATRDELYRRLLRARDYAAASFAEPVTLADLSRVACLSPNHLLRTFRQAFGMTPHQYLTERRLDEARRLLTRTEMTVTEVCLEAGFESLGSFSSLFRRRFGVPPSVFRREKGDFEEAAAIAVWNDAA